MRLLGLVLSILLLAGAAHGDSTTSKAKSLYDQGLTDYNLGHYEEALVAFEQAYRLRHDPAFLFNIGQCQRQLHRYQPAEQSYRAYLRESAGLTDGQRDEVQKLVTEMHQAQEDEQARAKQPPTGTQPPAEVRQQAPVSNPTPAPIVVAQPTPTKRDVPTYKKQWVWVVVGGVVAAGVGLGLGFGLGSKTVDPSPSMGSLVKQ